MYIWLNLDGIWIQDKFVACEWMLRNFNEMGWLWKVPYVPKISCLD